MLSRWGLVIALALGGACGKREQSGSPAPAPGVLASVLGEATALPLSVPYQDYVGAAVCGECHTEVYAAWKRSPHARAMGFPSAEAVLGEFSGQVIEHEGGQVVPLRDGDRFVMELRTPRGVERVGVDLWLASGRQQQVYFTRDAEGAFVLLPIFWATASRQWVSTALYQAASLDPEHRGYWRSASLERLDCWTCHLSQRHRRIDTDPSSLRFVDTSINCEACHGPGREHVARRRAGDLTPTFADLKALGKEAEGRLCGTCHGAQQFLQLPPAADGWPEPFIQTLAHPLMRPDGTQRLTTYQYSGHLLSRCYLDGAMVCSSCHDPHHQDARSLIGESAEGADSDKQCTVCHRAELVPEVARAHSRHAATVTCVDCHMAFSWIGDDPRRQQRTSDHSISIPRPAETLAVGTPNACTTCHTDRDAGWAAAAVKGWGWTKAAEPREWVLAVAAGRAREPGATARLVALLGAPSTDPYLRASVLELVAEQEKDPALEQVLAPWARDPDPQTRQTAIAALIAHAADAVTWRRLGSSDAHPFVRMKTFVLETDPKRYDAATIDRQVEDLIRHVGRPIDELVRIAKLRASRGEIDQAVALAEAALALATPAERSLFDVERALDYLRKRQAAGARK